MKTIKAKTKIQAFAKWLRYNKSNCNYKSWIKKRYNFMTNSEEYYFEIEEDNDIEPLHKKTIENLSRWADKLNN